MSPLAPCTAQVAAPAPPLPFARATGTALAVLAAVMLPGLLVGALAVELQRDLGFGAAGLGTAAAAFWIGAAAASLPAGRFVDRLGAGRAVHVAGVVTAASALGIAALARSHAALVVLLAAAGCGLALAGPGMSALVGRGLDPRRRGLALGVQQSGPPIAMLLAGVSLPVVSAVAGWRAAFAAAAVLALAAVAIVRSRDCSVAAGAARASGRRSAVGFAVGGACAAAVASAALTFLVPYATDLGAREAVSGALFAVTGAGVVVVRIAAGRRADRGADPLTGVVVLLAAGAAGFLILASGADAALVPGALFAVGLGWGWAGLFVLATLRRHPDAPGAALGLAFCGVYSGAIAGPVLGGVVVGEASYAALWAGCAVVSIAGAGVFAAERRREVTPAAPPARSGAMA